MRSIRSSIWLLATWLCCAGCAQAALVTRFVTEPPATMSTVSRFPVSVELYDTTAGARVDASGLTITLNLNRCPGYPDSCSVVVVQNGFASAATVSGLATFNDLTIDTAGTDYYFTSNATGYGIGTSAVRDVEQAVLRWSVGPQDPSSAVSRIDLQVRVHAGAGAGAPIDTFADGVGIRLALYRCPGYPGSCSVNIIDTNFANATANNGVANFFNLVVANPATDHYFFATTPAETSTGSTSLVFDVVQPVLRFAVPPVEPLSTASRLDLQVSVHIGPAVDAPVDLQADSVPVRLALYRCPGYPESCSVDIIDADFANAFAVNGVASFNDLVIGSSQTDYYLFPSSPGELSTGTTSPVFDVEQARVRLPDPALLRYVDQPFDYPLEIVVGSGAGAPLDLQADGVGVRLALYRCPGYPASCSVVIENTNYANATAFNGVADFGGLVIGTPATDYYFYGNVPGETGVAGGTGTVFDVEIDPFIFGDGFETP